MGFGVGVVGGQFFAPNITQDVVVCVRLVNLPRHRPNVLSHQRGAQTLDTTVWGEDGTLGDATKTGWWLNQPI